MRQQNMFLVLFVGLGVVLVTASIPISSAQDDNVTEDINQGQQQSNMSLTGELMPLCLGSGNTESICLANLDFCQSTGFTVAECDQYMGFSDAIPSPTVQKEIDRKLNETDLNGSLD